MEQNQTLQMERVWRFICNKIRERSEQFHRHVDGRNWRRVGQQQQRHQTDNGREKKEHWWLQVSFLSITRRVPISINIGIFRFSAKQQHYTFNKVTKSTMKCQETVNFQAATGRVLVGLLARGTPYSLLKVSSFQARYLVSYWNGWLRSYLRTTTVGP